MARDRYLFELLITALCQAFKDCVQVKMLSVISRTIRTTQTLQRAMITEKDFLVILSVVHCFGLSMVATSCDRPWRI